MLNILIILLLLILVAQAGKPKQKSQPQRPNSGMTTPPRCGCPPPNPGSCGGQNGGSNGGAGNGGSGNGGAGAACNCEDCADECEAGKLTKLLHYFSILKNFVYILLSYK